MMTVNTKTIEIDTSGFGFGGDWWKVIADLEYMTLSDVVAQEIEATGLEHCDCYRAADGHNYRW